MQNEYFPVVVQALAGEDFSVYAYFTDGTIHKYDMKPLLQKGGVIEQLKDKDFFTQRLTVLNSTVAWDLSGEFDPTNCIDIDPFEVYNAQRISDPLEESA